MKECRLRIAARAFVLGILLAGTACAGTADAGTQAPDFTLKDLSGQKVTLSSFKGKRPVLLAFSASWCPYCRKQAPKLAALRKKYTEDELAILGVNQQESRGKAAAFAEEFGAQYPTLLDKNLAVSEFYGVQGIPYMVLIDRDGQLVTAGHDVSGGMGRQIEKTVRKAASSKEESQEALGGASKQAS